MVTTKSVGDGAEARALAFLERQGLSLVARNYRLAGGPRVRGAEIDLVLRTPEGTLVFCEVRCRAPGAPVPAAATVDGRKRRRLVRAARHFLLRCHPVPPCRFDVVAIDGEALRWLPAAFDAGEG